MRSSTSRQISLRLCLLVSSLVVIGCGGKSDSSPAPVPSAPPTPHFGQALPGDTPVPFAPEKLNALSPWVEATAFSPDGTQFFASVGTPNYSGAKLKYSKYVNGAWTAFEDAPFASSFTYSNEPVFSADGNTLTFTAKQGNGNLDLWTVKYANQAWGTPVALLSPINSDVKEFRGSYAQDGSFYFGSTRSDPANDLLQVYKATKDANQKWVVEMMPAPINLQAWDGDPCIAPDGRFMVFYSCRDWKSADLYVSFRNAQGGWGEPIQLGSEFNSPADEYGAHLSSDGKQLFFTRHTAQGNQIHWVSVSAIDKLKPVEPAPYFGQTPPGDTPVLFAPEKLNALSPWVEATAISPDGTQFFAAVGTANYSGAKLYHSKFVNGAWTEFVEAPFASDFTMSHEPVFSADGTTLTFTGKKADGNLDLWTVNYANHAWGSPVALPAPINSTAKEFRGSYAQDGSYYFGSVRSNPANDLMQIYKATQDASHQWVVEMLPAPINLKAWDGDPCIAPDGRFIVFYSCRDWKSADLYVSFRNAQGGWDNPIQLGSGFNTPADEYGAHLSSNGKYLFFTRHTAQGNQIFWVSVSAIDKLKP